MRGLSRTGFPSLPLTKAAARRLSRLSKHGRETAAPSPGHASIAYLAEGKTPWSQIE
jgi:hypothetical protein